MQTPLLNSSTKQVLERLVRQPPHAIALSGYGSQYRRQVLDWFISLLAEEHGINPQTVLRIEPESGAIGIDQVRSIRQHLKPRAKQGVNRLVVLHDADQAGAEAQNALLKIYEEPPSDTVIILGVFDHGGLLPTIRSRSTIIELKRLDDQALGKLEPQLRQKVEFALNSPDVLADEQGKSSAVLTEAKKLLGKTPLERLQAVKHITDREQARELIAAMLLLLRGMLRRTLFGSSEVLKTKRLVAAIDTGSQCHERLSRNGSVKANLDLFLTSF